MDYREFIQLDLPVAVAIVSCGADWRVEEANAEFTDVVVEHFGQRAGGIISLLYFMSIFPILLIYGVGITNTVDSFLVNQVQMTSPRGFCCPAFWSLA